MTALQFGDDAKLLEIRAEISTELFEALASALRRGNRGEALGLLDRWHRPRPYSVTMGLNAAQRLTTWLQQEVRLHVEGSRYQHALALVERYVTLPVLFNMADAQALRLRRMTS
jgi:hypothetical protein